MLVHYKFENAAVMPSRSKGNRSGVGGDKCIVGATTIKPEGEPGGGAVCGLSIRASGVSPASFCVFIHPLEEPELEAISNRRLPSRCCSLLVSKLAQSEGCGGVGSQTPAPDDHAWFT